MGASIKLMSSKYPLLYLLLCLKAALKYHPSQYSLDLTVYQTVFHCLEGPKFGKRGVNQRTVPSRPNRTANRLPSWHNPYCVQSTLLLMPTTVI